MTNVTNNITKIFLNMIIAYNLSPIHAQPLLFSCTTFRLSAWPVSGQRNLCPVAIRIYIIYIVMMHTSCEQAVAWQIMRVISTYPRNKMCGPRFLFL